MKKRILVTAFEPFGKDLTNSSKEVLERIEWHHCDSILIKRILPVVYNDALVKEIFDFEQPDVWILLGQAGSRTEIELELIAINGCYSKAKDNKGCIRFNEKIVDRGPIAYEATLPVVSIVSELQDTYPIRLSLSAGGYICNYFLYLALHHAKENKLSTQIGFIHIPYLQEQNRSSTIGRQLAIDTINAVLETIF